MAAVARAARQGDARGPVLRREPNENSAKLRCKWVCEMVLKNAPASDWGHLLPILPPKKREIKLNNPIFYSTETTVLTFLGNSLT